MDRFGEFEEDLEPKIKKNNCSENKVDYNGSLQERIASHIASCNVIVKSQQRDEPDLTHSQKQSYLIKLLEENPSQFLYRYSFLCLILKYYQMLIIISLMQIFCIN